MIQRLPTPTYADAKAQAAAALEASCFVIFGDWSLALRSGPVEHRYEVYSCDSLEEVELACRSLAKTHPELGFNFDARELLATDFFATDEELDRDSGAFISCTVTLLRPGA